MALTLIKRFLVTDDFFEFNLKYLVIVGLWPDDDFTPTQLKLYKIYERTLNTFMIIFFIITGISTAQCTDIIILLSNIDKSVGSYNYFFKVICFVTKRDKLKILIGDIIKSGDKVTDDNKDNMIKLIVTITSLCTVMMVVFILVGLYNNEMSIEAWMPFNPYKNKMYLALSAQILALLFAVPFVYRAMGMQGMVCSILMYLCDQLQDLQGRLRRLKYAEGELVMREELTMIAKKHIRLLGYSNSMESMFKEYFLIQNFAVTLELCINAVLVATVTRDQIPVIFGFVVYLVIALLNAYVYCSLGNNLVEQSEEVAKAAYDADWTSWPVDLQKTMLLIITVSQRPFKMSAGGIAVIDIPNFATALYNGYSIFAVLNDVVN